MKKLLLILPIITTFAFNTALAESSSEPQKMKKSTGGPMAVFKRTSPMPLLMSVIVRNGDELGLSDKQSAVFTQWRVNNMATSLNIGNAIIDGEKAINQAALEGKPKAEIEKMMSSVLEKRLVLASSMLTCRDLMKKTLDAKQWETLISIYNKKQKMQAM